MLARPQTIQSSQPLPTNSTRVSPVSGHLRELQVTIYDLSTTVYKIFFPAILRETLSKTQVAGCGQEKLTELNIRKKK